MGCGGDDSTGGDGVAGWSARRRNGDWVDRWDHLLLLKDLKGAPRWYAVLPQRGVSQGYFGQEGGGVLSGFLMGRSGLVVTA